MTTMRTNLQFHEIFLRHLQTKHKELLDDLNRIKQALVDCQALIEQEQDYIAKESSCAESKPSESEKASTAT
jgi:hypothetical protein